jgi:hypothetical protein
MKAGALLVTVAAGVALAAAAAHAKTIRTQWVDTQPWEGGRIVYRTTKIWVKDERFAVTTSITNRTKHGIAFHLSQGTTDLYEHAGSFGIAWRDKLTTGVIWPHGAPELHSTAATRLSPPLPAVLRPGRTWAGTFVGRTRELRHHREWYVVYGIVLPARPGKGGTTWKPTYWVSAHTFRP